MNSREAVIYAQSKGYCVTSDGRVISPSGRALKLQANRDGYLWFRPAKNAPPVRVHRLQAFQSYGHATFGDGIEVRHLDGDKANNSAGNIALGTRSENQMDKPASVRRSAALKASDAWRRHDHAAIARRLSEGASYGMIQREFGIRSKGTISFIARQSLASRGAR